MTITKTGDFAKSRNPGQRRSRGRPQARPDDETRAVLLDAARAEFAANGYAATGMEAVARRARVSTKTLYRLIPTKAALFEAMITDRLDRFASGVRLRACDGTDIAEALSDALIVCGELMLAADVIALQRMILGEAETFPDIAATFYDKAIRRTEHTLAAWLKMAHKRGLIKVADAASAAGMLLGMLAFQPQRAVLFGHARPPTRPELARRAQQCAALFLRGCEAAP
jgi:AcrR family transcriptional regulator